MVVMVLVTVSVGISVPGAASAAGAAVAILVSPDVFVLGLCVAAFKSENFFAMYHHKAHEIEITPPAHPQN